MKRSWLLAAVMAVGLIAPAAPAAAAAASVQAPHVNVPIVTICLTYSSSWCADVAHDRDVSGEPVWIWNKSHAGDDHWLVVGLPCPIPDTNNCVQFVDARNQDLCIGIVNNRNAVLQSCNAYATEWLQVSNQGPHYIRWFAAQEYLTASGPGDGQPIFINYLHAGGWQQWSGQ